MEPIDAAYEVFRELRTQIPTFETTLITETDVRTKIIDPIFLRVLGWPNSELLTEDSAGGGFIDYNFLVDGRSHLIVEAKRDSRTLGCEGRPAERGFKLNGPVFRNATAQEGIKQAVWYCATKNAELACVTNGKEWIVFRGNRLGDGKDTFNGIAFIFADLDTVDTHFDFFFRLLSYTCVRNYEYRAYFQEAEGQPIRGTGFRKPLRPLGSARLRPVSELASDIDRIMTTFFHRLTGDEDPDMITACFVETRESDRADDQLARISEDLIKRIRSLDAGDPDELSRLIKRATESRKREFAIIVGTKGSGKSTFVTRFFQQVLQPELARECVVARINVGESPGDTNTVVDWLNRQLLSTVEGALFGDIYPSFQELEGIFFDEYTRLKKGPWATLYRNDHDEFQSRFGVWVEDRRRNQPNDYIKDLIRHVVANRKKLPVVIFDNADHFDILFQERVYQYARSIYENSYSLIILPITDRTSWQLSKHGALQSFEHESLFLPTPSTDSVIKKRINFLQQRASISKERPNERYFLERGITLSVDDIAAFADSLQRIFLQTADISIWIGELANHDVRRALTLTRDLVTSPYLEVEDMLKAYIAGTALVVPRNHATRALICGRYDIYPVEQNQFVHNLFAGPEGLEGSPLLGVRILQVLADAPSDDNQDSLLDIEQIVEYCHSMHVQPRTTRLWLDVLLKQGLVLNYDPTVIDVAGATLVEISPSGRLHLKWAQTNWGYLSGMADVTPLLSEAAFEELRSAIQPHGGGWMAKVASFVRYLVGEDGHYISVPEHIAFSSQSRLRLTFSRIASQIEERLNERQTPRDYR